MPEDQAPPISELGTLDRPAAPVASSFGRYLHLQRLGEGGMGEIWLAEQTEPVRRQVALKVIKAGMDSAHVIARFEAERQALALMDHPAIATVFDGGTTPQGRPYFAMEYVKGEPITTYCDRHRLSTPARLELFTQVCEGVQHAHQKGIIHRDLKPSNVLVTIQDDRPVPKIIDFGVAKAMTQHLTERNLFTELGVLIGTPEYMSPEQAEMGGLDIDTRTDIYALGVLLYEMLTGVLPFDRKDLRQASLAEIQRIIREREPPRPSTRMTQLGSASTDAAKSRHTEPRRLIGELRGDLDWITLRALEKDRTRRYQTANALAVDVRRHLNNEPVAAGPPSAAYRVGKFVRRHRFGVFGAITLVLLLVAFAGAMAVQSARVAEERNRAEAGLAKAEREAKKSKASLEFLQKTLGAANPFNGVGHEVTVMEVLARAVDQANVSFENQPEVKAAIQNLIGTTYRDLSRYDEAERLIRSALEIRQRTLGDAHPDVAASLNDLAWLLVDKGDYEAAEPLYRKSLAMRRSLLGDSHPDVADSMNNLAVLLGIKGDYAAAEPLLREVLAMRRTLPGYSQADVAESLNNLATLRSRRGDYAAAERPQREALAIWRKELGDEHALVAMGLNNLAVLLVGRADYQAAEPLHEEAVRIAGRSAGLDQWQTASYQVNQATCLTKLKRFPEAEDLLLPALEILRTRLGDQHSQTQKAVRRLAELYDAWGKPEKAKEWQAKLAAQLESGANGSTR